MPEYLIRRGKKTLGRLFATKKNARKLLPNIAAGFYDEDGVFHPIRGSWDYSRSRAGEKRRKPARRRRAKRGRRRRPH